MHWTWIVIAALVVSGPALLRWWARYQTRLNILSLPLWPSSYGEAAPESIPASIRDGLAPVSTELAPLGFELIGYVAGPMFPGMPPRIRAVHRHAGERAFATAAFALGAFKGATVELETLFEDGFWLRTVNRRGHLFPRSFPDGRVNDCLTSTVAEQWRAHQAAAVAESARTARDFDLTAVAHHLNAVDAAQHQLGVADGSYRSVEDGKSFRFTRQGADRFVERMNAAAQSHAGAPPLAGALAVPQPVDELERKYQDFIYIESHKPKLRGGRAFLLSLLAFAASAMLFTRWSWLLWVLPLLLLHELGHFLTLRMFGHRDATIRFIPFLGAATLTTTQFRKLSHEVIVLLAGPVPGIALALLLFQLADFPHASNMVGIAIILVTVNGLNLLPLHPLDGGRVVHALVTAGRPRLDLALRAAAGMLFVAGAVVFRDLTLGILAAVVFLLLRSGLRRARLENAIRRQPGFGPGLTAPQRRRFIFEALARQEGANANANAWLGSVRQLEISLGHGTPGWWPALPWFAVYATCLGVLCAWTASIFAVVPTIGAKCPDRTLATAVSCTATSPSDAISWDRRAPGSLTRNPFKLVSRTEYPYAAFVWCTGEPATAYEVGRLMNGSRAADGICPALLSKVTGRPPAESCKRIQIASADYETSRDVERADDGDADGTASGGGGSGPASPPRRRAARVRLAVKLATPADFEPLRRYLCEAGCEIEVLPYGSMDPRLRRCF